MEEHNWKGGDHKSLWVKKMCVTRKRGKQRKNRKEKQQGFEGGQQ